MQIHGGDIYNNDVELDFSANINPFGMPEKIYEAAICGVKESIHYPDPNCDELRSAISKKEHVAKEHIICGNGAAEIIFTLVHAKKAKQALVFIPSFIEYEQALNAFGCKIKHYELRKEDCYEVTKEILLHITKELDMMFLCNPNNPTGLTISKELLQQIIDQCKEKEVLLVLDECFQDFLEEKESDSKVSQVNENPFLFILKAFTKMYAVAGVRLGYGMCSDRKLIKRMNEVTQPWNVSIPAQRIGIAACVEEEFEEKTRAYIKVQREYLAKELKKLGFHVYPSKANYIFFEGPEGLYDLCLKQRILIRSCENYQGLSRKHYRVAVKLKQDNERLIQTLRHQIKETKETC